MFKFLKEKLKGAVKSISKKAKEVPKEEDVKKRFVEEKVEKKPKEEKVPKKQAVVEKPKEKKGFFAKLKEKVTTTKISEDKFDELFWELEVILLENNVATEVIDLFKEDLKEKLVDKVLERGKIENLIKESLKETLDNVFRFESFDLIKEIKKKDKKPFVICFIGINGSGKTTTIAKVTNLLLKNKLKCVLSAADTFRAAAIDQLEEHGKKLGVKVVKQKYGSDPAAVAFDAIEHAKAKYLDVVLIDTAGRMHSNTNLIAEMRKIIDVAKPDLKIFVGESITGNDCIEQAKSFNDAINFDGIILSKADVDEKGGAAISVSYITGKPVLYLGVGQEYDDLEEFDKAKIIKNLGL
jgi:fused signal recognition particle receptor